MPTPTTLATESLAIEPAAAVPASKRGLLSRLDYTAAKVEAATPASRDRLMDFLRVAAMLAVALGHWLMAVIAIGSDGQLQTDSLLSAAPATQLLTWALQVVPLFVVVAGWSSAMSLANHEGRRTEWIHSRLRRLLLPCTAYVVVVAAATPLVTAITDDATGAVVGRFLGVHLWFAASIAITWLITPALYRAWSAFGPRLTAALLAGVVAVDVAARGFEVPVVGWLNFLLVYAVASTIGFAWFEGLITRRVAAWMAGLGGALLVASAVSPWYPLSLVGVPGAAQSNNSPLSLPIALIAIVHVGLIVLASAPLRRFLARPRVWLAVVSASRVSISVYLWHLAGTVVLVGVLKQFMPAALSIEPLTAMWWATRPLWIAALILAATPLVLVAARFEQRPAHAEAPGRRRTIAAAGLGAYGFAQVALAGPAAPVALAATIGAAVIGRWTPRLATR